MCKITRGLNAESISNKYNRSADFNCSYGIDFLVKNNCILMSNLIISDSWVI